MKRLLVVLLVLIASVSWAADVKISNLPAVTTLEDTDVAPVVAGTTTSKITVANLKTLFGYHAGVTLSTTLGANLLGLSTQQLTLDDQTANYVFAGPTTGEAAAPSFRALVAADIPSLVSTYQPLNATLTALAAQTETEGSIQYYTAAATPAVLAKGTAYQLLNMNSGATAPTWTSTLGATGTRLTKIWATDLEVTNAPTINGEALTTILQPLNDDLTTLAGGGTANCLWGEKSDSSGIECKTSVNIQMDDSAAQFKSATASKGTRKFVQSSIDNGILLTDTPVVTGNATITTPSLGAGTHTQVFEATTQTLTGKTITVSNTEFIPVAWMIDGAAAPDALATVDLGTRQVKARTFASDSSEDLEFFWQAPADIADGDSGTAGFQVKWRPIYVITSATAPASGEGVTFALASCSSGDGDTGNCTVGDDSVVAYADLDGHAQYDVVYGTYTAMTVTDGAAGEAWMMKVYRDHDHASDDYGQVVGLIGIEIKYVKNITNGY